jgi:hypothetical protein
MANEFLDNASIFLRKASIVVARGTDLQQEDIIDGILFFALGIERVLKGILFKLNPVYVLKSQNFSNSVAILYKDNLLPNYKDNQEISKKPDADVLTFKLSLLRAKSVSRTTDKHTALLFSLSNSRDIIAHHHLSALDIEKMKVMLLRDFYPLIVDYCTELELHIDDFVGSLATDLAAVSVEHQETIEKKMNILLEAHKQRWEQRKADAALVVKAQKETKDAQSKGLSRDSFIETTDCPACGNNAILFMSVDFDYSEGEVNPIGAFVQYLNCFYCDLLIEEYDEIDYLELNEIFNQGEDYYY